MRRLWAALLNWLQETFGKSEAVPMNLITFRDHFSSLFQSAATDLARSKLAPGAATPGMEDPHIDAATRIAALWNDREPIPASAPAGITQAVWDCARQGFELMQAAAAGNTAQVNALRQAVAFTECDPNWAKDILNYVTFLAENGMRDAIPYIRAAQISPVPIPLPAVAGRPLKVAILGDWGTGTQTAINLLEQAAAHQPDVLIHLGDIYYSGTPTECRDNFRLIIDRVFKRDVTPIPVFTLSGNHDMYSGGEGYYGLLQNLNPPQTRQTASFFCLRDAANIWQFIGLDTGLHDDDPFNVDTVLTFLEADEEAWVVDRLAEFSGRTILLSHHQLFSALSQIGPPAADRSLSPVNPNLAKSFGKFKAAARQEIAAWFWGHEHTFTVYQRYADLARGRCLGNGAIPVQPSAAATTPIAGLTGAPPFEKIALPVTPEGVYATGFAILALDANAACQAEYYQALDAASPIYSEKI
jgi:3',5'-cyclic AMP phosphodiesterase CpdA